MMAMPGASLAVLRLRDYLDQHGPDNVAVHLVGHSAGAIFHAGLLQRLAEVGIPVASLELLAPAIRVDEFARDILPHLGPGRLVRSFAIFNLTDQRELDDVCGARGIDVYHKSLLYLVLRALEGPATGGEVPLLGMEKFFARPLHSGGPTLLQSIRDRGGAGIFSRSIAPDDSRSDATSHGGFAGDRLTMTSVVMRALGLTTPRPENDYRPNAALSDADRAPTIGRAQPAPVMAEVHPPNERPLVETGEPQRGQPAAPDQPGIPVEVAVAPRSGSPVLDVLLAHGWRKAEEKLT
jgi:acetyl esterase/lipase